MESFDIDHSGSDDPLISTLTTTIVEPNDHNLSFMVIVAFTVNYVMGTGFLTLPWAFHKCGIALGIAVLFLMVGPSLVSVSLILETMARAGVLKSNTEHLQSHDGVRIQYNQSPSTKVRRSVVGSHKFETTELCETFLGLNGKRGYTLAIGVFLYGTLWAYATVFANALASHIGFGSISYYVYLVVFGVFVVPLSCLELKEQTYLQVALSVCRVLMVVLMLGSVVFAFAAPDSPFNPPEDVDAPHVLSQEPLVNLGGLHIILPITVYANMFHHSIPALSEPAQNKRHLGFMFATALFFCFIMYSFIGATLALYFGADINVSSNLNWSHYGRVNSPHILPRVQKLVASFIIMFPALDVVSAFPLNAITLGNSLMSWTIAPGDPVNVDPNTKIRYRLLAAIPPILAASAVSDLGTITDYTGISGMLVVFVFPALLSLSSSRLLRRKGLPTGTVYSSMFTSRKSALLVLLLGVSLCGFTLVSLVLASPPVQ